MCEGAVATSGLCVQDCLADSVCAVRFDSVFGIRATRCAEYSATRPRVKLVLGAVVYVQHTSGPSAADRHDRRRGQNADALERHPRPSIQSVSDLALFCIYAECVSGVQLCLGFARFILYIDCFHYVENAVHLGACDSDCYCSSCCDILAGRYDDA